MQILGLMASPRLPLARAQFFISKATIYTVAVTYRSPFVEQQIAPPYASHKFSFSQTISISASKTMRWTHVI
jgi:hypothetical protein